jgi:hypothetical protein
MEANVEATSHDVGSAVLVGGGAVVTRGSALLIIGPTGESSEHEAGSELRHGFPLPAAPRPPGPIALGRIPPGPIGRQAEK